MSRTISCALASPEGEFVQLFFLVGSFFLAACAVGTLAESTGPCTVDRALVAFRPFLCDEFLCSHAGVGDRMAALIMRRASVQLAAVNTNSRRCFMPSTVTVAQNRYCCMISSLFIFSLVCPCASHRLSIYTIWLPRHWHRPKDTHQTLIGQRS